MIKITRAYLYKWTEISTRKWYRGSRTKGGCHPNDGYICSSTPNTTTGFIGVKAMILANPSDWVREIECIGDPKYIAELETKWLTYLKAKQDPMSYNEVNHWPNVGGVGKPSPQKGTKWDHPHPNKGKKVPAISIAKKGKKYGPQKNPSGARGPQKNPYIGTSHLKGKPGPLKGKTWSIIDNKRVWKLE